VTHECDLIVCKKRNGIEIGRQDLLTEHRGSVSEKRGLMYICC